MRAVAFRPRFAFLSGSASNEQVMVGAIHRNIPGRSGPGSALDVEPLFVLRAEPEPAALAESGPQDPGASGPAVAGGSVAGNVPLLI